MTERRIERRVLGPGDGEIFSIEIVKSLPAVADLSRVDHHTWELNRINVPVGARGNGLGRDLLKRVIEVADAGQDALVLWINPYGPLSRGGLIGWYERNGFVLLGEAEMWDMRREPR